MQHIQSVNKRYEILELKSEIFSLLEIEFEEWLNEWLDKGNDYIQPLSLLCEELRQTKKVLCLSVADGNIYNANDIYENWNLSDVYEWNTIKLATNYQNKEKK